MPSSLPPQILPNECELIPCMQGTLQGMGDVQHRVVHQHFNMFSELSGVGVPERLVQLRKPSAQAAQDSADRVTVLERLAIHLPSTAIAADKFGDPGNNFNLHLASVSGGWHIRSRH